MPTIVYQHHSQTILANVKEVTNKETSKRYAAKIVDKTKLSGCEEMMQMEIEILKQLDHPNILSLVDLYQTETHYYLVMQLATGEWDDLCVF
jgi:calcium/calmodulin-dependent protein kinase I